MRIVVCGFLIVIALLSVARVPPAKPAARDVTPDMAALTVSFSESFASDRGRLLVFVGRAGFRRTDNNGRLWHRAMDGYVAPDGVEPYGNGFCQAPSRPSTVYSPSGAILSAPVFRSDDLGRTWRPTGTVTRTEDFWGWSDCAVDPSDPDVVYVLAKASSDSPGLFKSMDGGRTFAAVGVGLDQQGLLRVRVSPTRSRTLYVIGGTADSEGETARHVYISRDGGETFLPLPSAPADAARLFAHPTRDGLLFVSGGLDDGKQQLFRSMDGGDTFSPVGPVATSDVAAGMALAFDQRQPEVVYVLIDAHGLYRSDDFGATFEQLPGPAAVQMGPLGMHALGLTTSPSGRRHLYVGTERGPYRSNDAGQTFTSVRDTFRGAAVNDLAVDAAGRLLVAVMHTVLAFRAEKPGHPGVYEPFGEAITATLLEHRSPFSAAAVAPSAVDPDAALVATADRGLFLTNNAGASWTGSSVREGAAEQDILPFGIRMRAAFAPGSATRVYLTARGLGLARSDDGGRSFRRLIRSPGLNSIAINPTDSDVIYLGGSVFSPSVGLHKSVDGGETVLRLAVTDAISGVAIDAGDVNTVYAGKRDGGILRSTDAGATWQDADAGMPSGDTLAIAADPHIARRVYAWVRAGGLFVSADGAQTWRAADTGEALRRSGVEVGPAAIAVDRRVSGRVYLGNGGVIQVDTMGTPGRSVRPHRGHGRTWPQRSAKRRSNDTGRQAAPTSRQGDSAPGDGRARRPSAQ